MTLLFLILVIVASVVLGFIVLIQSPKGGGLASNVGGISNQFMGVQQTTDVLEKGTWIFAAVIGVLCLISTVFMGTGKTESFIDKTKASSAATAPAKPAAPAATPAAPVQTPAQTPAQSTTPPTTPPTAPN